MKKFIIFVILSLLAISLIACGKKDKGNDIEKGAVVQKEDESKDEGKDVENTTEDEKDDAVDYGDILKFVGKENDLRKIVLYIDKNIKNLDSTEADNIFIELEDKLNSKKNAILNNIFKLDKDKELEGLGVAHSFPYDKLDDIKNEKLKLAITELYNCHLKMESDKGLYKAVIDYNSFNDYKKKVGDEIKDYISLMSLENEKPVLLDEKLYLDFNELAERAIKWENFMRKYSFGKKNEAAKKVYSNLMKVYMQGSTINDIVGSKNKIGEEVYASYKKTSHLQDSITAHVIGKYIESIDKKQKLVDDEIIKESNSLINEALNFLESSK